MELTKEQQADVEKRTAQFLERHEVNVKELEVDFAMLPQHIQIAANIYATQVKAMPVDTKYISKESPYKEPVLKS